MENKSYSEAWNWVFRNIIIGLFVRLYFRVKVTHKVAFPENTAILFLAGPHLTEFESLVLGAVLKKNLVRFLAKSTYWDKPLAGWFMRRSGQIPVDRSSPRFNVEAVNKSVEVLLGGGRVVLYPEATRGFDGMVHKGRTMAATIVRNVRQAGGEVLVVPVGMTGMLKLQPRGRKIPRPGRVSVHFGVPLGRDLIIGRRSDEYMRSVMYAIAHLANTGYVDEFLEIKPDASK